MKSLLVASLAIAIAGCSTDPSSPEYEYPAFKTSAETYNHHCGRCHGERGEGQFLEAIPGLSTTDYTYSAIKAYIKSGGGRRDLPHEMPSFANMTERDMGRVAIYIRRELRIK